MNDCDIIKALEHCVSKSLKRCPCSTCPLKDADCCGGSVLMPKVLDLINRQEAEIERLKAELGTEHDYCNHYMIMSAKARIEGINDFAKLLIKCSDLYGISESEVYYLAQELIEGNDSET